MGLYSIYRTKETRSGFIGERLLPPIRVIFTNTEECVKLVQETKATLDMSSRKRFNTGI